MAWSLDPTIITGLIILAALYVRGQVSFARRVGKAPALLRGRVWAFTGALAALFIALLSPLGSLAERLLSAHMMQHTLLMLATAPLLALSHPLPALLMAMPYSLRRILGRGWRQSAQLRKAWHWISQPLAAWLLQAIVLWVWHIPGLYQAAIVDERIHALEHLSMLGSALLFWWVALHGFGGHTQPGKQHARLPQIIYLLSALLPGGLLGILLRFAPAPWYPIYAQSSGPLPPLADQQLAATMMWLPSGAVYLLAAVFVMKSWQSADRLRQAKAPDPNL